VHPLGAHHTTVSAVSGFRLTDLERRGKRDFPAEPQSTVQESSQCPV